MDLHDAKLRYGSHGSMSTYIWAKCWDTHTRGSFFSMLWCLSVQEARDDRKYRKMFICGHNHQAAFVDSNSACLACWTVTLKICIVFMFCCVSICVQNDATRDDGRDSPTPRWRWVLRSSRSACRTWRANRSPGSRSLQGPGPLPNLDQHRHTSVCGASTERVNIRWFQFSSRLSLQSYWILYVSVSLKQSWGVKQHSWLHNIFLEDTFWMISPSWHQRVSGHRGHISLWETVNMFHCSPRRTTK